jgi:predicted nucleotidyltransferase
MACWAEFAAADRICIALPSFPGDALLKSNRQLCHSSSMNKGSLIETLRRHEPELRAAGIVHLRLFGSVARGEETSQSDVDLMADLDRSKRLSLVGMAHLENRLSDLLGVRVDLSPAGSMKEVVYARAMREAIHAF